MKFARFVFLGAGIYGLIALLPQYFLTDRIGIDQPPAITHSEDFYGFIGVAAAFQLIFLVIAGDPVRYRRLMPIAVIEKFSFAIPATILFFGGTLAPQMFAVGVIDAVLGVLFAAAFVRTKLSE